MKYRCLIWGLGKIFYSSINYLKLFELKEDIEVVTVTAKETNLDSIAGWPFTPVSEIVPKDYDLVIVMSERKFVDIKADAVNKGFSENRIVSYKMLQVPNLSIEKYLKLVESKPSLFVMNCFGVLTYNRLGLELQSPFMSMYLSETDFIKLMSKPKEYMKETPEFLYMKYNEDLDIDYPVCALGDLTLFFSHYPSLEEALSCWNRRKARINWDNIIAVMYTRDEEVLRSFEALNIEKKMCFTSFKTDSKCAYYIDYIDFDNTETEMWEVVNKMAKGTYPYYDAVELLLTGKIIRL